MISALLW